MHLYLIRHGQSYVNLPDWAEGNVDAALTELGQRQATALATWLPSRLAQVDVLYASTMRRARETAEPLARAYDMPIQWDDRVRELGNNRLDHQPWPPEAFPNQYVDFWASARPFAPPPVDAAQSGVPDRRTSTERSAALWASAVADVLARLLPVESDGAGAD